MQQDERQFLDCEVQPHTNHRTILIEIQYLLIASHSDIKVVWLKCEILTAVFSDFDVMNWQSYVEHEVRTGFSRNQWQLEARS